MKVGDTVIIVNKESVFYEHKGTIINYVSDYFPYQVSHGKYRSWFNESELSLLKPEVHNITPKDTDYGHVRSKMRYYISIITPSLLVLSLGSWKYGFRWETIFMSTVVLVSLLANTKER